jgi:peroxiredoxin
LRLKAGDAAVPFTAQTAAGPRITLEQFAGKPALLMFFRYASCPMCNLRLRDFSQAYPRLHERGLETIAFFHSSVGSIRAHAGRQNYPFVLAADPAFQTYRAWGVETSWPRLFLSTLLPGFYVDWVRSMRYGFWGGVAMQLAKMPADFLISPDGRIAHAHYGRHIGDHLTVPEIDVFLDEHGSQ